MASDNPAFVSSDVNVESRDPGLPLSQEKAPECSHTVESIQKNITSGNSGSSSGSMSSLGETSGVSNTSTVEVSFDDQEKQRENNKEKISVSSPQLGKNVQKKQEQTVYPEGNSVRKREFPSITVDEKLPEGSGETPYPAGEERRMLRNVAAVGAVFMLNFTALLGATHLQSSVNAAQGLGTSALAAQYAGLLLSSLVVTVPIINKLGCKWTIVAAIVLNMPYMAAQLYPRVYTLVPAALLMGVGVAPLWSAKCTYLCIIAEAHSQLTGATLKAVRDKVIGLFFMIFLLSMVWGNLVSSVVLSTGEDRVNGSLATEELCGLNFCPGSVEASSNPNLERPSQEKISIIIGVYLACMGLACVIAAVWVDSLKRYKEGQRANSASGLSNLRLLTVTMELHCRKEMLLMVPISVWLGVDYAFVEAEYTASFVACAWGIRNIGYVIICYGLANSGLALATGWLVARAGRRPVLCVAAVLHATLMAALHAWRPSPDHKVVFFLVAALWGAADGHWAVQINSLYAILFPGKEEAAYSNFRLWQSVGFIIAFSYSHYLCAAAKLYVVLALLAAGVAGYLGIEYSRSRKTALLK